MRIVIDPSSLQATASVLRSAADVLGEICSHVAGAVGGVYAPPSVAAYADSATASASSTIHSVIYELLEEAADLERRASCCCAGESTSLPVPALVGLAFGGTAIGTAASSPRAPMAAVSGVAAAGAPMSIYEALGNTTLGGTAPVATASPGGSQGISIYEALGSSTLGGPSPAANPQPSPVYDALASSLGGTRPGYGISMEPNPSYNYLPVLPNAGVGPLGGFWQSWHNGMALSRPYTLTGNNSLFAVGFLGANPYG
jgi:hypothetical protein